MLSQVLTSTQSLGVLAPSQARFERIAQKLDAHCVWLNGSNPLPSAESFNTIIIDSDLLCMDSETSEPSSSSTVPQSCACTLTQQGGVTMVSECAQLAYFKSCGRYLRVGQFRQPDRLVIFQCTDTKG